MIIEQLQRTKLYRPRLGFNHIRRPALVERLNKALAGDLALVNAPVGFGKTSIVVEWAEQLDLPLAWASLDANDNHLRVFLSYLLGAIRTLWPDACPTSWAIVRSGEDVSIDTLVPILINEIDDLPQRFVLVLDDYHEIDLPTIHDLLDRVLRRPPMQMFLVLISRADPPLALGRLRAGGHVAELRAQQLRFSDEASVALLQRGLGDGDVRLIEDIARRSEGWAAGLQLATLAVREQPSTENLQRLAQRDDPVILDYLFDQVLRAQPTGLREFLVKLAILNHFNLSLACAVAGIDSPTDFPSLTAIERAGLFLNPLDGAGEWYRFHALFRDMLLRTLEATYSTAEVAELHRRACRWFADAEAYDDAVYHALVAGDADLAVQVARQAIVPHLGMERLLGNPRFIDSLPPEVIDADPVLLIAKAAVLNNRLQWDMVLPLMRRVEEKMLALESRLPEEDLTFLRVQLDWLWSSHWGKQRQPKLMRDVIERALAITPEPYDQAAGPALVLYPVALQWLGEFDEAERWLNRLLAESMSTSSSRVRTMQVLFGLTTLYLSEGFLDRGQQVGRLLFDVAEEQGIEIMSAWANLALGAAAYLANDLQAAIEYFEAGVSLRYAGSVVAGQEALAGLALCYQSLGRRQEAQGVMAIMADYHRERLSPHLNTAYRSMQARLALIAGDLERARRWSDGSGTDVGLGLGWLDIPAITDVRIRLAGNDPAQWEQCQPELAGLLEEMRRVRQPTRQVELLALRATLDAKLGRPDDALATLEEALSISEPRGLLRPYVDAGTAIEHLLERAANRQPSVHVQSILLAFSTSAAVRPGASALPRLTPREREVLDLLAQYQTDRAIAEALIVSPLTVRTHIENLSEKFGVRGRRAIVTRAREMGYLG